MKHLSVAATSAAACPSVLPLGAATSTSAAPNGPEPIDVQLLASGFDVDAFEAYLSGEPVSAPTTDRITVG